MVSLPAHLKAVPVGREPLPREVMIEHQRDRVLGAAVGVFAKRGYQNTTVDHIVAAAHIGVGTFYSLFDGKEGCYLRAYEQILSTTREEVLARLPKDADWPSQARSVLATLLELIEAEPMAARLVLIEAQTAGPAALQRYEQTMDELIPLLARARALSSSPDLILPATLEIAIVGGLAWFLQQQLALPESRQFRVLLPELAEIVLEPYLGEVATAELLGVK